MELSVLFEEAFGHVPTAEINAAWFQCLADPRARVSTGPLKRGDRHRSGRRSRSRVTLPLLPILILLIRRDGGPGLFTQVRIGEGGRRFRLHKLRTMSVGADASAQWACPDDPRTTRIGAILRRTHLDELPQLVNVIRGEMSLVGPRPEQPAFVDRLEGMLPFYQRRHLMRPGITGWAQIRCGYAGSDVGSAWKLCHDLYYAKHRSIGVDLLILCETFATLFFAREPVMHPESVALVLVRCAEGDIAAICVADHPVPRRRRDARRSGRVGTGAGRARRDHGGGRRLDRRGDRRRPRAPRAATGCRCCDSRTAGRPRRG